MTDDTPTDPADGSSADPADDPSADPAGELAERDATSRRDRTASDPSGHSVAPPERSVAQPTIRHRDDVAGCGCVRCQAVDYDVVRRSIPGAFLWALGVLRANPIVIVAFVAVGATQIVLERGPADAASLAAIVGFVGVFLGRGYVGLLTARALRSGRRHRTDGTPDWTPIDSPSRLRTVFRRLPAFLAAAAVVGGVLFVIVVAATTWLSPALGSVLAAAGLEEHATAVDAALLVATAVAVLAVLVKCCFLPEACFVGGYGPVSALRVSWSLTAVHRVRAVALTVGLLGLFVLGALLDTRIGGTARPVVLSVTLYDTTVAVRSVGLTTAGPLRLLADASLSALYYAAFTHQYVHALFADG